MERPSGHVSAADEGQKDAWRIRSPRKNWWRRRVRRRIAEVHPWKPETARAPWMDQKGGVASVDSACVAHEQPERTRVARSRFRIRGSAVPCSLRGEHHPGRGLCDDRAVEATIRIRPGRWRSRKTLASRRSLRSIGEAAELDHRSSLVDVEAACRRVSSSRPGQDERAAFAANQRPERLAHRGLERGADDVEAVARVREPGSRRATSVSSLKIQANRGQSESDGDDDLIRCLVA